MQATWQALQPMHFETSMSFATSSVRRICGAEVVEAERRVTSSVWRAMSRLLDHARRSLLDVHQERLELRGLGVAVADERGERVREVAGSGLAVEPPVQRDADGVDLLAVDLERLDPLRDDRLRHDP